MSASREKKLRQDQTASGYVDPKAEKELEEKKAEKRSNVLYSVIAVLFVLVVAASFLWRSNVISRNATALTIDGEKYSAAEVNFYYQNVYRGFLQSNSYFISYLGLDTNASLKSQTVNATAASMMGVEEGSSWHDYIMDNTVKQMTMIQRGLKQAQEEGYQFPASVQEQYEDSLNSLKTSAESTGMSVKAYLQKNLGAIMTEKVYNQQVLRMLQYQAYAQSYSDSLTYTDAELEAAYQADPKAYDKAAWEYVVVSGAADSTTDADGNTVEPTDEENAAAKAKAESDAAAVLARVQGGEALEDVAKDYESASYTSTDAGSNNGSDVANWVFDSARKAGDSAVVASDSNCYVVVFRSVGRQEYATKDVRHILFKVDESALDSEAETYEADLQAAKDAAKAAAEDALAQWKAGEATEDSFAALANELSVDDGSNTNGGLYTKIYKNQMVTEFNDWCFDASRQSGDTGIVYGESSNYKGYHVIYFVGDDVPYWQVQAENALRNTDTEAWLDGLLDSADVVQENGMKHVG